MEKTLVSIYSQYRAAYERGLSLKTAKAQRKAFDLADAKRLEFNTWLALYFRPGEVLELQSDFAVTQKYPLTAGILKKGALIEVLDVMGGALNVAVSTDEYPDGEVFSINFLDGFCAHLNVQNLDKIKAAS